ncbi:MAG: hypothetical protein PHO15_11390, partial [Eubacteriales bacterium]|nr:hypothetical protein [Eubacteriales bacterium]
MKLLSSFKKELILATRSFYFYIEVFFALVLLAVLMFAIPEHSSMTQTEYIYLDMPEMVSGYFISDLLKDDLDGQSETTEVEADGETFTAERILTDEQDFYFVDSEYAVRTLAETHQNMGAVIELGGDNQLYYTYY